VGLRETINQKPSLITGITVGVIVVALALIIYTQRSNRPAQRVPGEKPVYIPPTEDKPVDVAPPDKARATKPPGRAASLRPRKILASAAVPAAPSAQNRQRNSTTEILG
jgi:hypothetical protein